MAKRGILILGGVAVLAIWILGLGPDVVGEGGGREVGVGDWASSLFEDCVTVRVERRVVNMKILRRRKRKNDWRVEGHCGFSTLVSSIRMPCFRLCKLRRKA